MAARTNVPRVHVTRDWVQAPPPPPPPPDVPWYNFVIIGASGDDWDKKGGRDLRSDVQATLKVHNTGILKARVFLVDIANVKPGLLEEQENVHVYTVQYVLHKPKQNGVSLADVVDKIKTQIGLDLTGAIDLAVSDPSSPLLSTDLLMKRNMIPMLRRHGGTMEVLHHRPGPALALRSSYMVYNDPSSDDLLRLAGRGPAQLQWQQHTTNTRILNHGTWNKSKARAGQVEELEVFQRL
jgi:hypothetical protein